MPRSRSRSRFLSAFRAGTRGINALTVGAYPQEPCAACKGAGVLDEPCDACSGRGRTCACADCEDYLETGDEGSFAWSECDTCGSGLGGVRYAAHGLVSPRKGARRTQLIHLAVCTDCLVYIANGETPEE